VRRAGLGVVAAALGALALAGCGLVTAAAPTAVQLLVTRDFGGKVVYRAGGLRARPGETVGAILNDKVLEGPGVSATVGVSGTYFVNGVQSLQSAGATSVQPGDHIWWDGHEASAAASSAAVVGSYPEPFLNGLEGKRLPTRIECASASTAACNTITARLRAAGVPAAVAAIGSGSAPETLRVMVGPWTDVGSDVEAASIADGPASSGVYARFASSGQTLTLLDVQGRPVKTLSADAGLIAATLRAKEAPVWVVTGTDEAGVTLAARAFDQATLADRFAVALDPMGAIALPVTDGEAGTRHESLAAAGRVP
jgi:hypothetical protein